MQFRSSLILALAALAACGKASPDSAYYNRGGPESLLDVSSEVVNLSVADMGSISQLDSWIAGDPPTRAELYCNEGEARCADAQRVLERSGVPVMTVPSGDYTVSLVYERILARDCSQRFVDNHNNHYNTNHPAFGCSVAANMVQHVSDKQSFINPALTDVPSAEGAVQAYQRAYTPKPPADQQYDLSDSIIFSGSSGGK